MAKVLADLALRLTAETAQLKKGVQEANATLKSYKAEVGSVGNAMNSLKDYAKGLMPALAIGTFVTGAIEVGKFALNISKLTQEIKTLTGASGSELNSITARVSAIASTYDKEFKEISTAANSLSKQMGISFNEALGLIQGGFAAGGSASEEFIDSLKEYPAQFKAAGYSAEEFVAITAYAGKEGIFGDKAIDSIKEATLKIREMPTATKEAITSLGLSVTDIQKGLQNGTLTIKDVITQISQKMATLPPTSSVVGTAIADIFGSAGEDAGLGFITGISKIPGSLKAAETEVGAANNRLIESQTKLNEVWGTLFSDANSGWTNLKATVIDFAANAIKKTVSYIVDFINYFIELYNNSMLFRILVQQIIMGFKNLWEVVKYVALSIINQFKSAGEVLAYIFNPSNWGKGFGDGLAKIINNSISRSAEAAKTLAVNVKDNFVTAFNNVVTKDKIKLINDPFAEGEATGKKVAEGMKQGINKGLSGDNGNVREKAPTKLKGITTNSVSTNKQTKAPEIDVDTIQKGLDTRKLNNQKLALEEVTAAANDLVITNGFLSDSYVKVKKQYGGVAAGALEIAGAMQASAVMGGASMKELGSTVLNTARQIISAEISKGIAAAVSTALSSYPAPYNLIVGGIVGAGAAALFNSIVPKFADGAVVSSPTYAMIGEAGSEAVLNKMQLGHLVSDLNNSGNINIVPEIRVKRGDLYVMFKKEEKRKKLV